MNIKKEIEKLEASGYEVDIHHERRFTYDGLITIPILDNQHGGTVIPKLNSRGGRTLVWVYDTADNNRLVSAGVSVCCNEDNYNKNLGVQIALGRALKEINNE